MRFTRWFYTAPLRLRSLFRRRQVEQELDEELRYHLDRQIEELIAKGMTPIEARYAAMRALGGLEQRKEEGRGMRRVNYIDDLLRDLRYAGRNLRRNPGFAALSILIMTLGIGANTAIFSVVNAVLLRPLPYRDPDRLVMVSYCRAREGSCFTRPAEFLDWRDQAKSFERIAAYRFETADLTGDGEPERLDVASISADLFATLGVAPALGRAFTSEEDTDGGPLAAILSDRLWRRRFGADPQVIGRAITLRDQSRTVVGIMPPDFRFHGDVELWFPLAFNAAQVLSRQGSTFRMSAIARLKPGVTPEAARADLSTILERQRQAFPNWYIDLQVNRVIGLSESLVGAARRALLVIFGAVAFVLLIACANMANLILARSAARQKEMAIRAAIGAHAWRLARQSLTESLLLSSVGAAAGLLVAKLGVKLLVALSPGGIARIEESGVDGRALGFTCAVAVLTGLLAGLFPALQASKTDVNETLKSKSTAGGAWTKSGDGRRTLPALMIVEIALSLVLLVGAGLMIKSFLRLLAVPMGFNPDGLLTLTLSPNFVKYPPGSDQRRVYFQEALARFLALPGVQSASLVGFLPLGGPYLRMTLQIEGRAQFERGKEPVFEVNHISPDYFQTMGAQLRAGRPFTAQDDAEAPPVVIINETLARRFFPGENPIGHRLLSGPVARTIIGVAGDTRHHGLDQEVRPEVYFPYMQHSEFVRMVLVARVTPGQNNPTGLSSLSGAIRGQLSAIEPNEPVNQIVTMDERLSNSVAQRRFQTILLGVFAALALIIAAVGIDRV